MLTSSIVSPHFTVLMEHLKGPKPNTFVTGYKSLSLAGLCIIIQFK